MWRKEVLTPQEVLGGWRHLGPLQTPGKPASLQHGAPPACMGVCLLHFPKAAALFLTSCFEPGTLCTPACSLDCFWGRKAAINEYHFLSFHLEYNLKVQDKAQDTGGQGTMALGDSYLPYVTCLCQT